MTDVPHPASTSVTARARRLWSDHRIWLVTAAILLLVTIMDPAQGVESLRFTGQALLQTAPYLLLSIGLAAYAGATGADGLIARAFTGAPVVMILVAAAFGGLSPFCSCGVIPLIAALLAMGVPLSAVMAFWLASPVIDPSMFALTAGVLGLEFAVAKTLAAIGLGLFGGYVTLALTRAGAFAAPLRDGVGNGGCGASSVRNPTPPVWAFWHDAGRRAKFGRNAVTTTIFQAGTRGHALFHQAGHEGQGGIAVQIGGHADECGHQDRPDAVAAHGLCH
ncbi:MAG: permease, partial [Pseudomonadota bacterium]